MSSWFKSVFFIGMVYNSLLQAMSSTPAALSQFLASEQSAFVRDQLRVLNPRNIPIAPILLELARQREARTVVRENGMSRTFAVVGAAFTGIKWFSRMFLSGVVLMKDGLSLLASFFGKDIPLGAFAVATAGGFIYLRHQVGQVQETQGEHTRRLESLQIASSTIISTQGQQGQQLTDLQASVGELQEGQRRLEENIEAAQGLLQQLNTNVASNGEALQSVSASVQDLVKKLCNVEQGLGTLSSGFEGLQASVNASNATFNQRFTGFETIVTGLRSRVDDGVCRIDQLHVLLQQSVSELRTLVGENTESVNGTIQELQSELTRLTGVLDEKALAMQQSVQQSDANAQKRHDELRNDMQRSVAGLDGKLDHLIAASSQTPTLTWQMPSRSLSPFTTLLLQRNQDQQSHDPFSGSLTPSGFPRADGSSGRTDQRFIKHEPKK